MTGDARTRRRLAIMDNTSVWTLRMVKVGRKHGPREQQVGPTVESKKDGGEAEGRLDQPESRLAAAQAGNLSADRSGCPGLVSRRGPRLPDADERGAPRLCRCTAGQAMNREPP